MTEIVSAINRILELDQTIVTQEIDGRLYSKFKLNRVPLSNETAPSPVNFNTLTGLVAFAKALPEKNVFFHVESPTRVTLLGELQPENFNLRFCFAEARTDFEPFAFASTRNPAWVDLELFVISLQSMFWETESREDIISLLGSVSNEAVETNNDDGFSQSLHVRIGISLREKAKVENPVYLRPYRTFREVDQPEGRFILRIRKKDGLQCSLWEADGGLWKSTAMKTIKEWLDYETEIPVLA